MHIHVVIKIDLPFHGPNYRFIFHIHLPRENWIVEGYILVALINIKEKLKGAVYVVSMSYIRTTQMTNKSLRLLPSPNLGKNELLLVFLCLFIYKILFKICISQHLHAISSCIWFYYSYNKK